MAQMRNPMNLHDPKQNPECGLYVGDLEEGVTEEQLFVEFRKHGALQYVKLHRYPFIGKSKHFGFLYFSTKEEAEKARVAMNYKELLRHPIRVTTLKDYEKESNVFFAGFESNVTLKAVDEYFAKWGPVFSVKLSLDEHKKSRGYGWVQYETKAAADAVVEESNVQKLEFGTSKILVKKFVKKGQQEREDKRCNLYVKNFWPQLTEEVEQEEVRQEKEEEMKKKLQEWFGGFGNIISIFVKIDVARKAPFAFISFENNSQAKEAQKDFGNKKDPLATGRPMYVGWAQTKKDRKTQRDNNVNARYVYLEQLARNITEEEIRATLKESGYGEISLVRLEKLQQGFTQIIRIGYLVFEQAADANRLIRTYKESESLEKIKALFEPNADLNKYFQYLFTQQNNNRGNRRYQQNRVSPQRRMPSFPFPPIGMAGMPMPYGMPPQMGGMMPPQMGGALPMMPPGQGYQPGYNPGYQPRQQNQRPPYQQNNRARPPQNAQKIEYVPVASLPYDKRPDLQELLNNLAAFQAKNQDQQTAQFATMIYSRLQKKLPERNDNDLKTLTQILTQPDNFNNEEIIGMLKDEAQLNEYLEQAEEVLKEKENEEAN